jgi:streptomycin 6-kinase
LIIPRGLQWWRHEAGGHEWLERLPRLAAECAEAWGLELGAPFEPAHISLVVPVGQRDGSEAVLKLNFPEPESENEADALAFWDGRGAVRLLARDDDRRALLLERCRPGSSLWEVSAEDEANEIAAGVLARLWRGEAPEDPFRRLETEALRWADELPLRWEATGRPFERSLVDRAVGFLRDAVASPGEPTLVHQDLHGGNILRAQQDSWLAIDPKPLAGEREFDTASLLRDRRNELIGDLHPERRVRRRLDLLCERLGLERERMQGWGVAHALAWGYERNGFLADHVTAARAIASIR